MQMQSSIIKALLWVIDFVIFLSFVIKLINHLKKLLRTCLTQQKKQSSFSLVW